MKITQNFKVAADSKKNLTDLFSEFPVAKHVNEIENLQNNAYLSLHMHYLKSTFNRRM